MRHDYENLHYKKKHMKAGEAWRLARSSVAVLAVLMPLSSLAPGSAFAATRTWVDITHGGSFSYPEGVAVDSAGDVFVTNYFKNTILEHTIGSGTWQDITNGGAFNAPNGIAVDSAGDVFVANYNNGTILERSSGSTTWKDITNGGGFSYPTGIAVDSAGNVFVANSGNNTILERISGSTTWKDITNGGGFNYPTGIAVDSMGDLFVASNGNRAVYERPNGSTGWQNITNGGGFNTLYGIAADGAGDVFVIDMGNDVILERTSGSTTWQAITNGDATFNIPLGIAVDNEGNLYVTNNGDTAANAVEEYSLAPQSLVASNTTSTSITLAWNALAGASSYNVYENGWSTPIATGVTGTSYTLNGLNSGESFWFTVSAVIGGGESAQSAGISVETIPTSPTGLQHMNVTQTGWTEAWTWNLVSTGYNVYINGTKVNSSPIPVPVYTVTGEKAGTTYRVTVTAVDAGGETVQSKADNVTTLPNPPSVPTSLSSNTTTSTSTTLSWIAASGATSYNVYENKQQIATGVTGTSYTVNGLTPGTSNSFTVSAVNAGGESVQSSVVNVLTTPAAPTKLTHNNVAQTGWTESWSSVSGATGYNVYINGVKVTSSPVSVPTYTVAGETAGTTYSMTVSAVDANGESVPSKADSVPTLPNAPSAPKGLSSNTTTSASTTLSWYAASSATSYNVYENGTQIATGVSSTSYTVSGLKPGTSNSYTVSAVNAGGESTQSSAINVLTEPAAPTKLTHNNVAQTGWTELWSSVSGATGYNVYINGAKVTSSPVPAPTYTVTGETAGTTYRVTVTAVDASGEGVPSKADSVTTLPNAPSAPKGLSSNTTTSTSTTLSWNAASGAASYNVYEHGTQIATGVSGTSYTVNGLTPGTSNPFTVSAVNAGGESVQSNVINALTLPSTPIDLVSLSTTSTSTTLNWSVATGATSYDVYETSNSTPIATGVTSTSYKVNGLTPGKTYSFTVRAVGSNGESGQSSVATITTANISSVKLTTISANVIYGSTVTVNGVVYDTYNVPVPYAIVNMSSLGGTLSYPQVIANESGQFTVNWTAPNVNQTTNESVTASVYGTVYQSVYEPSTSTITPTTLSFSVAPMLSVSTPSLLQATVNSDYSQTLQARGGFRAYTWSVTTGTLPSGLSLDSSTGIISGTPTTTGTSSFTVQVTDADGNKATQNLAITANAAPTYLVAYNGNGNTSGSVPKDINAYTDGTAVTVLGNTGNLVKNGYTFEGWNTAADGSGTSYSAGRSVTIGTSDVTLYAQWKANSSGGSDSTSGKIRSGTNRNTNSNTNNTPPLPTIVTSHTFSSEGGAIQLTQNNMTVAVNVPQGTFPEPTTLTVTTGSAKNVTDLVNGLPDTSVGVVLGVNFPGAAPSKPITVTITDPSILADTKLYKLTADGELVPMKATVSAGKAVVSFTSDPDFVALNVVKGQRVISMAGQARIVTGLVQTDPLHGNKTTYLPIWYVMQMLKTLNVNSTWDGHNWHITTVNTPALGTVPSGTGSMHLYVNGTLVENLSGYVAKDPQTGVQTTYMPIWYVMQMLKTLNIGSSWNGTTWTLSNNSKQSGNTNSTN